MPSPVVTTVPPALTVSTPRMRPFPPLLVKESVPALTVVPPVWVFTPESVNVPAPVLIRPPVVAAEAPDKVRLAAAVVTSTVLAVPAVSVKARSLEAVAPVYCRVPPPRTRLAAAFVAWPRLQAVAPLPMFATLSTPALMVVMPV